MTHHKKIGIHQKKIISFFKPTTNFVSSWILKRTYKPKTDYKCVRKFRENYLDSHPSLGADHSWRGFYFVASDDFCEYEVYDPLRCCYKQAIATATIDSDGALEHIKVKALYQRRGIGSELIRFIYKVAPQQLIIYFDISNHTRHNLDSEGTALIKHCLREKIIPDSVLIDAIPQTPSFSRSRPCYALHDGNQD
ncbi:MAG: hypothetical protein A3I12_05750 [Gammaproteobacteria bacterium RIFCSPLOWO2_02_FULL_38_11]|nr:MAG: hypothetical protein A3I12_05750 [Gammaproteobacteria bacterium RIFCSPLOWO2_02_FULL_38_11]OGT75662.1 MAG: hypothetical protein A3G71_06625 [Gammaproteobacteria bacterium RIFCSPLOWO2_12_FULL_38_14]